MALPGVPKLAVARLVEATVGGTPDTIAAAQAKVTDVTAPYLDRAARSELAALTNSLLA